MRRNLYAWLFALAFGVVLPGLLLRFLPAQQEQQQATTVAQEEEIHIRLLQEDGTVKLMELEDYVLGVVSAEMPAEFHIEALKAQAVLARTYGLKRSTASEKHPQGAVCMQSSCCQAFSDVTQNEAAQIFLDAVSDTAGIVLTYEDELIEATYFSCSGGYTEDAEAVWGTDVPYLQAVASPGEETSQHFVTTVKFTTADFSARLGIDLADGGIEKPVYTDGGGVHTVVIGGKEFTGVQLRQLLGLKSTAISMSLIGDQVIVTTKGYGHRVGMSQYGADAMAESGNSYEQILAYYYPGTSLIQFKCLTKSR